MTLWLKLTQCAAAGAAFMAHSTRRVLLTRVKRESLGKYEAEPRRLFRLFTLHDASLTAMWGRRG
jgi:hypothetical protein